MMRVRRRLAVTLALSAWSMGALPACARHEDPSVSPAVPHTPSDAAPSPLEALRGATDAVGGDGSPSPSTVARADSAAPAAKSTTTWATDIRTQRWSDAAAKIDALPPGERDLPETRYARARVALALNDAATAALRLEGLEASLPLLAGDIALHLAEARLVTGPYEKAGEYFGAHANPASLLLAADAYEKAHDLVRARAICQRVIGFLQKTRLEEAHARACELRLSPGPESTTLAVGDARWISVHAPDTPWGKEADVALQRLAPSHPLLGEELLVRAEALADAGRTDDALRALDRVAGAPPPKIPRVMELRERGEILYRTRGRALEAAHALDESAALGGPHWLEDKFHAARALARADSDDEAVHRLTLLAKSHPGTHWGDEAQYFVPYLALLHGKWREAAAGFDEYLKAHPKGAERRDAEHGGALAHLMNEDFTAARRLFEEVAVEEPDPIAAGRARELGALAALREGDRLHAIAGWTAILQAYPLSWAALVSHARLLEIHAPAPPWVEPRGASSSGAAGASSTPLVVKLPPPVDLLHRLGLDADAEAALHDREGIVFGAAPPGRGLEALCAAYGLIGRAKRRYHLVSQIPVDILRSEPAPSNRWAWECAYPTPFADDLPDDQASARGAPGVDSVLAYAVMRQESNFDPDAVSPAHAVGLMQLIPETARAVAAELRIPYDEARLTQPSFNVALGTRYLGDLGEKFAHAPARLPLVVAAYNAGDDAVTRWLARVPKMDIDEFVERIPYLETRAYVARVMANWAHYEYLKHGEDGMPALRLALQE